VVWSGPGGGRRDAGSRNNRRLARPRRASNNGFNKRRGWLPTVRPAGRQRTTTKARSPSAAFRRRLARPPCPIAPWSGDPRKPADCFETTARSCPVESERVYGRGQFAWRLLTAFRAGTRGEPRFEVSRAHRFVLCTVVIAAGMYPAATEPQVTPLAPRAPPAPSKGHIDIHHQPRVLARAARIPVGQRRTNSRRTVQRRTA
jgi:hypothetical protein